MTTCIGENIRAFINHKGFTQQEVADAIGVGQTCVSAWVRGAEMPRLDNAQALMAAFPELSHDDIYGDDNGFAKRLLREAKMKREATPLMGSVAAGQPNEMTPVNDSFVVPEAIKVKHPQGFLLRVSGESMNKVYPNGSYVLVDPMATFVDGKAYAVSVDRSESTVKLVRSSKTSIRLIPCSYDESFLEQEFKNSQPGDCSRVEIIGRVVWNCAAYDFSR